MSKFSWKMTLERRLRDNRKVKKGAVIRLSSLGTFCTMSAVCMQPTAPPGGGGGEGTSYKWANGDVPLHGVAFSLGGGSGIMNHKS